MQREPIFVLLAAVASSITLSGCAQGPLGGMVQMRNDAGTNDDQAVAPIVDGGSTDGIVLTGDLARTFKDESVSFSVAVDGGTVLGNLWSVWDSTAGTVVTAGDGATIMRSQKGGLFTKDDSTVPSTAPALLTVTGITPGGPMYACGENSALWQYTGSLTAQGTWVADKPGVPYYLYGVWVAPDGAAFAAGNQIVLGRVADASCQTPPGTACNWTPLTGGPVAGEAAYSIWGIKTGTNMYEVFAVGCHTGTTDCSTGKIWHYTGGASGGTYVSENSGTSEALYGVWGTAPGDVYAVGDKGFILHRDSTGAWTAQNSGVSMPLEAVGGSGPDEIYAVGDSGTALHKYDHTSAIWYAEPLATPTEERDLYGVSATTTNVYFVGQSGAILHK